MRHPIKAEGLGRKQARTTPSVPSWPNFQGTPQLVGTSPSGRVTVYFDPELGDQGLQNAQDLLGDADRVVTANDAIFGTPGEPVNVIIFARLDRTDGKGGADHGGCDYVSGSAIEVCASFGSPARVSALFEAELSECSMGGNLCGVSTGEALSRWCAAVVGNNVLPDYSTAPRWAEAGMPDYVNQTALTDVDPDSTGCGMAFLSWLMSQGYGLDKIAQAMVALGDAGTLAELYGRLTSEPAAKAWPNFTSAINSLPAGITNDDPFGGVVQPAQLAHMAPWTVELAGRIFATILSDVASAKPAHQMVASVRAVLLSSSNVNRESLLGKASKSRPLLPVDRV